MSVNDAIKDMLYGHEHRWRVAEHELAQARAEAAALRDEVEAMRRNENDMRAALSEALSVANDCHQRWSRGHADRVARATRVLDGAGGPVYPHESAIMALAEAAEAFRNWRGENDDDDAQLSALVDALDALRARKVGG